jgi:hypothetical protein
LASQKSEQNRSPFLASQVQTECAQAAMEDPLVVGDPASIVLAAAGRRN